MNENPEHKLPTIDALHEALESDNRETAKIVIASLHPSEIADILESVPSREREDLWGLIDAEIEGDVLAHMQDAVRAEFLEHLQPDEVIDATKDLEADDVADILQDLPEDIAGTILQSMDAQNRLRLSSILTYPENTAGGLMNVDVVAIRADVPLDVVARYLRLLGTIPEKTDNIMVVDRKNKYLGVLPLAELLIRDQDTKVSQWMEEEPYVFVDTQTTEVAKVFEQRDLVSAAVVDKNGFLLGRITVDDVVDVIQKKPNKL